MKTKQIIPLLFIALAACGGCAEEPRPVTNVPPRATFDSDQESFATTVNAPFSLRATVTTGGRASSHWFINDRLEAATPELRYTFAAPGTYTLRYVSRNGAGEYSRVFTVTVADLLAISLSTGDSTRVKRKQLDDLQLAAIVESGAGVSHLWRIDGVDFSTEPFLHGFTLAEVKEYSLTYTGTNAVGTVEKTLVVEAIERPLEIRFSETGTTIDRVTGDQLSITATVLHGGTGIVHEWTLDGHTVATTAELLYPCTTAGEYALAYHAVNAIGETLSRGYTLRVTAGAYLITDCENLDNTTLKLRFASTNSPGLTIQENPYKGGINTSDKVMKNAVNGTSSTSGFFDLSLSGIPDLAQYKGLRFKIYREPGNEYYPHIKFNKGGSNMPPVALPTKYGEWETIEFRFPAGTAYEAHQIRPLSTSTGANITTVGNRTILMDDFELTR
ncbi:MAG: PKD domain-containing protein [Odoribacteraceae bacterium]|jgi:hypothetical protein|nr:PKD domain-containing protein [Odoribacteraceae bacterium]